MKLAHIAIKNFMLCKRAAFTLRDRGVVLVLGTNYDDAATSNGSGKSTLFIEAPVWCLFGRTVRGLSASDVAMLDGECVVELDIALQDSSTMTVVRSGNKPTTPILLVDGKDVTPAGRGESQRLLERLIRFDYDTFVQTAVFGNRTLRFATATDADKKATLERAIGSDVFDQLYDEAKRLCTEAEMAHAHTLAKVAEQESMAKLLKQSYRTELATETERRPERQQQIATARYQTRQLLQQIAATDIDNAERNLLVLRQKLTQVPEVKRGTKLERRQTLQSTLTALMQQLLDQLKQLRSKQTSDDSSYIKKLKHDRQRAVVLQSEQPKLETTLQHTNDRLSKLNGTITAHDVQIRTAKATVQNSQTQIDNLVRTRTCPLCGQPIKGHSKAHNKVLEVLRGKVSNATDEQQRCRCSISKLSEERKQVTQQHKQVVAKLESARQANQWVEAIDQQLQTLEQAARVAVRVRKIRAILQHLSTSMPQLAIQAQHVNSLLLERQQLQKAVHDHENAITIARSQQQAITLLEREASEAAERLSSQMLSIQHVSTDNAKTKAQADTFRTRVSDTTFWTHGFGVRGLKSHVLDRVLPFFNARISYYTRTLLGQRCNAKFSPYKKLRSGGTRENLTMYLTRDDKEMPYQALSGGEVQRADWSIVLALQDLITSRTGANINVCMFDEAFVDLDEQGIDCVLELIQLLSTQRDTEFIITNQDYLQQRLPTVVRVEKRRGIVSLVE